MKKLLLFLLFVPLMAQGQDNEIFEQIRKGKYMFDPIKISGSTINSVSNNFNLQADGYYFRFDTDSLSAYVPYVGVMTNSPVPDASSNAIIIESKVSDYSIKELSHGKKIQVTFNTYSKHSSEYFRVVLVVTKSGSSDVIFKSGKRSYISFTGQIH